MFIDIAKIFVKSGDGGDGAVSFHREKYVASGGPDGGDGGKGGDIIFEADTNISTLADFRYKRKYIAPKGENGKPGRCTGKSARDLIIKVPRGTIIKDANTGRIIADISSDQPVIIAKGGKGGFGNFHFRSSTRQAPRFAKPGMPGEELELQLELKLLADVGIIGYPNVGKSTLISVVSQAKPIIADYHFTTITPVLGVVSMQDGDSFVMADIPGLIENANEGVGLGHQFLRHVERCRVLIHVVDVSGSEGRDPIDDFEIINSELKKFNSELSKKPMVVAANKCDLADDDKINRFKSYVEKKGYEFFPIMAAINYGVDDLIKKVWEKLSELPAIKIYEPEKPEEVNIERNSGRDVNIKIVDGIYVIESKWLLNIMRRIDFDDYESLQYFQNVLLKSGITDKLKELGISDGDTVSIYDIEFDYVD